MDKKILVSVMVIGLVAALAGAGLYALFNDTETSGENTFQAGTLDLEAGGPGFSQPITVSDMKPGDSAPSTGYYKWVLKNAGSIPGKLSVTFNIISDDENGENEPEEAAEEESYGYLGARPKLGDPDYGELSEFLKPGVHPDEIPADVWPYLTIIERNDAEGWWIGEVSEEVDIGGSGGWGPKTWSVPSDVISQWAVGPKTNYGTFGLKSWDGKIFVYGTLAPGAEIAFFFRVALQGPSKIGEVPVDPNNLRAWDGCGWHDIDDNVVQSDSVTFNITFRLEQVP
jgi:predicted ribosomally synthesized peptide with SipW-like signal peptide